MGWSSGRWVSHVPSACDNAEEENGDADALGGSLASLDRIFLLHTPRKGYVSRVWLFCASRLPLQSQLTGSLLSFQFPTRQQQRPDVTLRLFPRRLSVFPPASKRSRVRAISNVSTARAVYISNVNSAFAMKTPFIPRLKNEHSGYVNSLWTPTRPRQRFETRN